MLIARVFVNTVIKGDIPIVRDADGRVLVPAVHFEQWGLSLAHAAPITVGGEPYIVVSGLDGLAVRFDEKTVTLELQVAAKALPTTTVNLGPQHRAGVTNPTDTSVFLNYGLNANGDDRFGQRRYQVATELGARAGNWLFYNTTDELMGQWIPSRFYPAAHQLRNTTIGPPAPLDDRRFLHADLRSVGGVRASSAGELLKPLFDGPYFIQYRPRRSRPKSRFRRPCRCCGRQPRAASEYHPGRVRHHQYLRSHRRAELFRS
jgi:hypothetical protein